MNAFNRRFVYFICLVSAMGGLLFGYDWVVIGGAKPFYEVFFNIQDNPSMQGWAMSIALAGCLVGAMTAGALADRFGRKPLLIGSAVLFLLSAYATGAVSDFSLFLWARLVGGIGIGIASGLSPMYIAEVAPPAVRGRLVSLNQLTIVLGILAAQITNWLIAEEMTDDSAAAILASWNGRWGWRWMFWAEAVPSVFFLILACFIPESPRWLAMRGRSAEAEKILSHIGGPLYAGAELKAVAEADAEAKGQGGLRMLFSRPMRLVLLIGVVIAFLQQWCGTNVIFNYAQEVFQGAGYSLGEVLFNIVVTGVTNVVFTLVAIYLVDRIGRRTLMIAGAAGLAVIYLLLGYCYYLHATGFFMVVLVMAAIACYATTLGPVTWVLLAEIFPNKVRAVAMATSTFVLWVGSFTLTYTFPIINAALGSYGTFWIYALICAAGWLFCLRFVPETKGKTLEELQRRLAPSA